MGDGNIQDTYLLVLFLLVTFSGPKYSNDSVFSMILHFPGLSNLMSGLAGRR